ncbi:MAG TPA: transcription-repair coupling factor [Geminicoccaceae bacterium]|nr:transcription-repair coupling factor [Geminicoccaceae bacterium]
MTEPALNILADLPRPAPGRRLVASAVEGLDALYLANLAADPAAPQVLYVARDGVRADQLAELARFFAPDLEVAVLPAWDCLPYDRVSPNPDVMARRLDTLARLLEPGAPRLVITTINALVQKVPPPEALRSGLFAARAGERIDRAALLACLARNGYRRAGTVVEPGEYAVRGGILDIFPSGSERPLRLDLFGDELERIRAFDPLTQRSEGDAAEIRLRPVSEVLLDEASIERFRVGYLQQFGAVSGDPLFDSVTAGRPYPGMEHWLPLFHERLVPITEYLAPDCVIGFDHLSEAALEHRQETIGEHYAARREPPEAVRAMGAAPYRPLPPDRLYLSEHALSGLLDERERFDLVPFAAPAEMAPGAVLDLGGRRARDFAAERARPDVNLFQAVAQHLQGELAAGKRMLIAGASAGSLERLRMVLADHGVAALRPAQSWAEVEPGAGIGLAVLPLEHGFVTAEVSVLAEADIVGDRLSRPVRKARRSDKFIAEVAALGEGDLVVHRDHGIGRFDGLVTLSLAGAPHDCLRLIYQGGDKLFVPVEHLDVLSRYGSADGTVQLDKLGGLGWQARKAKVKKRIREIAGELIEVAARRATRKGAVIIPPPGLYEEFAARFAYDETEDQARAIEAVLDDLASGQPMDRLVCGDVGFGKTEVALRAAFVVAMAGKQVAILAPTTLLVRQHFQVMRERFAGLPLRIEQVSRFVPPKQVAQIREGLAKGEIDIVVGTHALLSDKVKFRDLGLVVVDEEQHFGVVHKEKLKQLRAEVHMLAMTATPIPRTLQMALGGLKELSIIATPPVDRLAVRAFVLPTDPVVLREAILREHYRGGQTFYVCPRIEDQARLAEQLRELVPEVKLAVANGRMPARQLEEVMAAFYDRKVDLLVTTNIIESGLDVPTANTLIVHRADRFGLSQLYQLRGRIGRGKVRGYAYFTLPPKQKLRETAERRLHVIQSLDELGAGFQLASHDLDIRGAGNLLGEEQSGHIKEVGFELYNHLLEEAVMLARQAEGGALPEEAEDWSPQITIDAAALIPETYIQDLDLRLQMYRRLAALESPDDIEAFAAELIDRFGPLPAETEQLLQLVGIKQLCKRAGVAKVEAGPKGVLLAFHENRFAHPERLVGFIADRAKTMRVRSDHCLVLSAETKGPADRLKRVRGLVEELARLAA